jgi:hypothetical protein
MSQNPMLKLAFLKSWEFSIYWLEGFDESEGYGSFNVACTLRVYRLFRYHTYDAVRHGLDATDGPSPPDSSNVLDK